MSNTTTDLYRSVRKDDFPDGVIVDDHAVTGVLYPSFEPKPVPGRMRPADVTPYRHNGEDVIDPGGGTSLFDRSNTFGHKHWWYFKIPEGTVVPESLRILDTGYNAHFKAQHHQIEAAAARMPVDAYKGALDNLARNAVAKLYEDAH